MISIEDCIALSGLTKEEILAIAEHECFGEVQAAALGHYLLRIERGATAIRDMIVEDIRAARARGDHDHACELLAALRQFLTDHPEARATRLVL